MARLNVPMPLLAVTALEILGLKVNPVDETLEYAAPSGPAVLQGTATAAPSQPYQPTPAIPSE